MKKKKIPNTLVCTLFTFVAVSQVVGMNGGMEKVPQLYPLDSEQRGYTFEVFVGDKNGNPVPNVDVQAQAFDVIPYPPMILISDIANNPTNNDGIAQLTLQDWFHNRIDVGDVEKDEIDILIIRAKYKGIYERRIYYFLPNDDKYYLQIFPSFSFVHLTDLHIGGDIPDYGDTGWDDGYMVRGHEYRITKHLRAAVDRINLEKEMYNTKFVFVTGDLTDSAEKSEFRKAKEILDNLLVTYIPLIGNHDIWPYRWDNQGDFYEADRPLGTVFFKEIFRPLFQHLSNTLENWEMVENWRSYGLNYAFDFTYGNSRYHFICLDSCSRNAAPPLRPGSVAYATLSLRFLNWLDNHLQNYGYRGDNNIFIFAHHSARDDYDWAVWARPLFTSDNLERIADVLRPYQNNIYGWFGGHTHASRVFPKIKDIYVKSIETPSNQQVYVDWPWGEDYDPRSLMRMVKFNLAFDYISIGEIRGGYPEEEDWYEPDDRSNQATIISDSSTQVHSIYPANDIDWLKFTLNIPSRVVIEYRATPQYYPEYKYKAKVQLYDSQLNPIQVDYVYTDQTDFNFGGIYWMKLLSGDLPPGDYYVKIFCNSGDKIRAYSVKLATTPWIILSGEVYNSDGGPLVEGVPYLVVDDVVVPDGKTLTIYQGTKIYFKQGVKITANGLLEAYGKTNPISLVSEERPDSGMKLHRDLRLEYGGELRIAPEGWLKAEVPNPPDISGPMSGKVGRPYEYTFVSTDPQKDDVYYYVDWGDGVTTEWLGPYGSGREITLTHTWTTQGNYTIKAKAKDVNGYESDWATLEVSMPKDKPVTDPTQLQIPRIRWCSPLLQRLLSLLIMTPNI